MYNEADKYVTKLKVFINLDLQENFYNFWDKVSANNISPHF